MSFWFPSLYTVTPTLITRIIPNIQSSPVPPLCYHPPIVSVSFIPKINNSPFPATHTTSVNDIIRDCRQFIDRDREKILLLLL